MKSESVSFSRPMYRDQMNFVPFQDVDSETSHLFPSVTVPDQSYTIEELIERYRAGILTDLEIAKEPVYYENSDFDSPDMEKMMRSDIVEKQEFVDAGKAVLDAVRAKEKADGEQKAKLAEEARINQLVEERVKAQKKPLKGSEGAKPPK